MRKDAVSRPMDFRFPECGIAILESHHAGDFRMRMQAAPYAKILHPLAGRGRVFWRGRSEPMDSECVCLVPSGVMHRISDVPDAPQTLMVVCFRDEVVRTGRSVVFARRSGVVPVMRRILRAMFAEQSLRRPAWGTMLTAQTLHLLALFERAGGSAGNGTDRRSTRHKVGDFLKRDPASHLEPVSIDEIAETLQISRRSFTAAVRELCGCSWGEWVHGRRAAHAAQLLRQTDRSVASIAFECGFEDLSSFYRAFKKFAGMNPTRWRAAEPMA